jgi:beta-galactosidase
MAPTVHRGRIGTTEVDRFSARRDIHRLECEKGRRHAWDQPATLTLRTTGPAAAIRLVPDTRKLTTSRDDLAHVLVTIVDAHGRLVPDAVHRVEFAVRGAGTPAAVGNGNPHNAGSFRRLRRHTWHGRALAILRPAKTPGVVTLTASAPGLRPSEISLPVRAKD